MSASAQALCASAILALAAGCSQDRATAPAAPVYDADVAPILQAHCVQCHGDTSPAAGWSATSYLGAIACVTPSNAPATLPPDDRAPILSALDIDPHRGLVDASERATLVSWVGGGTPAYQASVHDPSIVDPRSPGFHGAILRASRWSQMLSPDDPNACGRCHDGTFSRPAGVTEAAPGAPSCTSCHDQPGGVLACPTCHGSGDKVYPPRDPCFFPGDVGGAHAVHVESSPERTGGVPCSTCHPVPGTPVISGLHGDGVVEVTFDSTLVPGTPTYNPTTGACAVYCHAQGGAKPNVTWTEAPFPVGCGDCHGSPPAGHYVGPCTGCHAEANATGTALSGGPLHLNGKIDLGDGSGLCGACHGSGSSPWPSTGAHSGHQNPTLTVPLDCANCHVVPSTILDPVHLDGTVHVTFSELATARGSSPVWDGARCTNVACHGANLADPAAVPAWNDTSGMQAACGACHGIPPSQHTASTSCDRSDCHGGEITLDESGAPHISASGKVLHVDGVIESARGP
ncbi:MAG: CxxxxCH/CxxCH domain c-type cytochrome [Polyangiaceae bacterium]